MNCHVCGKTENLHHCSKCRKVSYCGVACQRLDWADHKKNCNNKSPPSKSSPSYSNSPPPPGTPFLIKLPALKQELEDSVAEDIQEYGSPAFIYNWLHVTK